MSDLSPLSNSPTLQRLDVRGITVTAQQLQCLETLTHLHELDLSGAKVTADGMASLKKALPNCRIIWDGPATPPAPGTPNSTLDDPAFQKWMGDVAALPPERQVEAVAQKLQQLNPGFDGKVFGPYFVARPRSKTEWSRSYRFSRTT